MLTTLYNALWYPALPFALLATGATRVDTRERLGRTRADGFGANSLRLWIHAASVGEIEAVRSIAAGLLREIPGTGLVVTAMTSGGRQAARRRLPAAAHHLLAPFDCPTTVRAFLRNFRPNLVLIAETELWPNFFREAARARAKIAIINGRLSERSMRRYRLARSLFASALALADLILVQTAEDAGRYVSLGAPRELIRITGNTKFDVEVVPANLRPALQNFARECPILVAGSTAPGEERMVLTAYAHLVERFPWLALVIAPRHLERVAEVALELNAAHLDYVRASALSANAPPDPARPQILLLDTMGELRALYQRATVAFVGGSMAPPRGGQNLAEPAAVQVPVLFGPHYENQRQVGDALVEGAGGRVIHDAAELESVCAEWLADPEARHAAGQNARRVVERLAGGAAATVNYLKTLIEAG
jgi:3-deoxy-D-manno-octulosonic-acid transferase